jgi:hypothetical protein
MLIPTHDARNPPFATDMKAGEREELERQGAKAAARGDPAQENPLLASCNTPPSTGETPDVWRARVRAWQTGFDAQKRATHQSPEDDQR